MLAASAIESGIREMETVRETVRMNCRSERVVDPRGTTPCRNAQLRVSPFHTRIYVNIYTIPCDDGAQQHSSTAVAPQISIISQATRKKQHVLIVGAGVAGLQTARALDKQGIAFTILERSDDVGGVWRDNYEGYALQGR